MSPLALAGSGLALAFLLGTHGPCDMKELGRGYLCPTCEKLRTPADLQEGRCKDDQTKPVVIDVCVKKFFRAECHPEKVGPKPIFCDGKLHDRIVEDGARVIHECAGCKEKAFIPKEIKHAPGCAEEKTEKKCEKSGTRPHSQ